MKISMSKHGVTSLVDANEKEMRLNAGWQLVDEAVKAVDEVIRLKPPVKSKATERALEEANATTDKGDE